MVLVPIYTALVVLEGMMAQHLGLVIVQKRNVVRVKNVYNTFSHALNVNVAVGTLGVGIHLIHVQVVRLNNVDLTVFINRMS